MHIVRAPVDNPMMIRGIVRSPESVCLLINIREVISYDHRMVNGWSSAGYRPITNR